jgi:hypothetical protein
MRAETPEEEPRNLVQRGDDAGGNGPTSSGHQAGMPRVGQDGDELKGD